MNAPRQTQIRYKKMRDLIGNADDKIILDIGAGYRPISQGIASKRTIKMDGVEKFNPDICCNINDKLPLKDKSVDAIIAGEIIEHLFNPIKFIRECNRVLPDKGILILSVPNLCSVKNRIKVLFGNLPESCAEPIDDESFERHIVDFNLPRLAKILKESKFRIIKKTSNGVIFHSKLIWPLFLTPPSFGETIIIKAIKDEI